MLTLRALEPEDLDLLYEVENDRALWPASTTNEPYSYFVLRQYLERSTNDIYTDRQLRLVIEQEGVPVGFIDLLNFVPEDRRAEVGVVILKKYRHQGYCAQALLQLERYACGVLHIHQLYAHIARSNEPCQHAFRSAGYAHGATLRQWIWHGDDYEDVVVMQKFLQNIP